VPWESTSIFPYGENDWALYISLGDASRSGVVLAAGACETTELK
jgi:hypothetical protein